MSANAEVKAEGSASSNNSEKEALKTSGVAAAQIAKPDAPAPEQSSSGNANANINPLALNAAPHSDQSQLRQLLQTGRQQKLHHQHSRMR
jgi:hypothetical protein